MSLFFVIVSIVMMDTHRNVAIKKKKHFEFENNRFMYTRKTYSE